MFKSSKIVRWIIILSFFATLVLIAGVWFVVPKIYNLENQGYGAIGALFTALAFSGVFATILMHGVSLGDAERQFRIQNVQIIQAQTRQSLIDLDHQNERRLKHIQDEIADLTQKNRDQLLEEIQALRKQVAGLDTETPGRTESVDLLNGILRVAQDEAKVDHIVTDLNKEFAIRLDLRNFCLDGLNKALVRQFDHYNLVIADLKGEKAVSLNKLERELQHLAQLSDLENLRDKANAILSVDPFKS